MTQTIMRMKVLDEMQTSRTEDTDTFHLAPLTATEISNKTFEMRRDDSAVQKQHQ